VKKPLRLRPRTFLTHEQLLPRVERLVAFVNGGAVWTGIPAAQQDALRAALRRFLEKMTSDPRPPTVELRRALSTVAGLVWSGPVRLSGSFFCDDFGQQQFVPDQFESPGVELLATAGDLINPGTKGEGLSVRVRRCECKLFAPCDQFLVNNYGAAVEPFSIEGTIARLESKATPNRHPGDKPRTVPSHRLLNREKQELNKVPLRKAKTERPRLLEKFRNDKAAREEAAAMRRGQ
jgi:hypothetical protein